MADKEGNIPYVCTWKTENGRVEINIIADAPKDIVLKMDKGSKLNIKHSEKNLEIVISKQQQQQQEEGEKAAVKSQETTKMEQNQGSNNGQAGKQSEDASNKRSENAWRKRSENVLGNVVNMLKEHRGIILTAVVAISLGLLLRRKFKAV